MTVVTQFVTDDGTDHGELVEMRRLFVQDGQVKYFCVIEDEIILSVVR